MFVFWDHTLTLLKCGTPCCGLWYHWKALNMAMWRWLFRKFLTNKTKIIEFRRIFMIGHWIFLKIKLIFSTNQCLFIILTFDFTIAFSYHVKMHGKSLIGHPIDHPPTKLSQLTKGLGKYFYTHVLPSPCPNIFHH